MQHATYSVHVTHAGTSHANTSQDALHLQCAFLGAARSSQAVFTHASRSLQHWLCPVMQQDSKLPPWNGHGRSADQTEALSTLHKDPPLISPPRTERFSFPPLHGEGAGGVGGRVKAALRLQGALGPGLHAFKVCQPCRCGS